MKHHEHPMQATRRATPAQAGGSAARRTTADAAPGNRAIAQALARATSSVAEQGTQEGGVPLEAPTRALMEHRFAEDFSEVRLHDGPKARRSAQALQANAFTFGPHIVFEQTPARGSRDGQRLLAHELSHVVQQRRGGAATEEGHGGGHAALEHEADTAALHAINGQPARIAHGSAQQPQREPRRHPMPPALPPALLESMRQQGLPVPDSNDSPVPLGDLDPELAAAAGAYLQGGKKPPAVPADFLKIVLPSSPDAPAWGPGQPLFPGITGLPLGPSLWPPSFTSGQATPQPKAAARPAPAKAAPVAPALTTLEGQPTTQDKLYTLENEQLLGEMKTTIVWLRAHKESSKPVEQAVRYYLALSNAYLERRSELALRRAWSAPKKNLDQKLADSAAAINLGSELAPSFAFSGQPLVVPPQILDTLEGRDEIFHDELTPPTLRGGNGNGNGPGGEWRSVDITVPQADPHYLDNFTGFGYDGMSQVYVLHFKDGAEVQIPKAVIDNPDFAATLTRKGFDLGIQAFKPRGSDASGVHLPQRLNPGTLPNLYNTIDANREAIGNADAGAFVGRNLLTYEDIPGSEAIGKLTMVLSILRAGMPRVGYKANPGRFEDELPPPKTPASAVQLSPEDFLHLGPMRPGNDNHIPLPEPLARTGTGDFFFPQPRPQLRLLPDLSPGANPMPLPLDVPVASAGGGGRGGGFLPGFGSGWRAPTSDVSGIRIATGGGWNTQARRAQAIKAQGESLDQQIAAERDRINTRRATITPAEWRDARAGLTKRLYNLLEQQHALQIAQSEPTAVVLGQVKILGVQKGGTFTPTEDIAGEGRIPDVGVLKPRGKLELIDSKTASEVINSIRKRGAPALKPSSPISKQIAKENDLRKFGGDWILEGTDPITGETFTFRMSPTEVDNSRPVPYGQVKN